MSSDTPTSINVPVEFIDAISHAISIEDVLVAAAKRLPTLLNAKYSIVSFMDESKQISRSFQKDGSLPEFGKDTKIYKGTFGAQVLETGTPMIIDPEMMRQISHGLMPQLLSVGVNSVIIAPMKSGGKIVGTLTIATTDEVAFDQSDVTFLVAVGKWVASQARLMQQARRTARLAETDGLTGLANRARLMRVLDGPRTLNQADSRGRVLGLLHIDLDHFKEVNDSLGHAAGDAILKHAAAEMIKTAGPKDLIARTGGDEFVIVTRAHPNGRNLIKRAKRIAHAVSQPIQFGNIEAKVGVSIGIALATEKDDTAARLISNADMALYEVKRRGRGEVHLFDDQMRANNERRIRLLSDLQRGVVKGQFEPFFQPQVSLATGQFSGFEMLARWRHPELGLVDPLDFLSLFKEIGCEVEIDDAVRFKGLDTLRFLRRQGWTAPKMSFNASSQTLAQSTLIPTMVEELWAYDLTSADLVIEVREADLMTLGQERSLRIISDLNAAGFSVELDDFGTGLTSITAMAQVEFSGIKLDKSMVARLPHPRAESILRSAMALAKELKLTVVAEGVETPEQFNCLRKLGCHYAQGFGISKPVSMDGLIDFMEGYGKAPVALAQA